MSRIQLALNVGSIDEATAFYSKLFDAEPAKVRDGYVNFAIDDPPLKLVLIEKASGGTINHLGVEVESSEEVGTATSRLQKAGIAELTEEGVVCCYAEQDKVWATGPDGERWEYYTVLADADSMSADETACC